MLGTKPGGFSSIGHSSAGGFGGFGASSQQPQQQQANPFNMSSTGTGFGQSITGASGGFGQPQSSGFGQTASTGGFGQPQTGGFRQPQTGGFGHPQTGGFGQPQTGGFGQPQTGGFGQPQTGGFGQPQTSGVGQPQTGGFGQPQTRGFGQAQTGSFGQQPQSNVSGQLQAMTGVFGQAKPLSFGTPQTGGFGQSAAPTMQQASLFGTNVSTPAYFPTPAQAPPTFFGTSNISSSAPPLSEGGGWRGTQRDLLFNQFSVMSDFSDKPYGNVLLFLDNVDDNNTRGGGSWSSTLDTKNATKSATLGKISRAATTTLRPMDSQGFYYERPSPPLQIITTGAVPEDNSIDDLVTLSLNRATNVYNTGSRLKDEVKSYTASALTNKMDFLDILSSDIPSLGAPRKTTSSEATVGGIGGVSPIAIQQYTNSTKKVTRDSAFSPFESTIEKRKTTELPQPILVKPSLSGRLLTMSPIHQTRILQQTDQQSTILSLGPHKHALLTITDSTKEAKEDIVPKSRKEIVGQTLVLSSMDGIFTLPYKLEPLEVFDPATLAGEDLLQRRKYSTAALKKVKLGVNIFTGTEGSSLQALFKPSSWSKTNVGKKDDQKPMEKVFLRNLICPADNAAFLNKILAPAKTVGGAAVVDAASALCRSFRVSWGPSNNSSFFAQRHASVNERGQSLFDSQSTQGGTINMVGMPAFAELHDRTEASTVVPTVMGDCVKLAGSQQALHPSFAALNPKFPLMIKLLEECVGQFCEFQQHQHLGAPQSVPRTVTINYRSPLEKEKDAPILTPFLSEEKLNKAVITCKEIMAQLSSIPTPEHGDKLSIFLSSQKDVLQQLYSLLTLFECLYAVPNSDCLIGNDAGDGNTALLERQYLISYRKNKLLKWIDTELKCEKLQHKRKNKMTCQSKEGTKTCGIEDEFLSLKKDGIMCLLNHDLAGTEEVITELKAKICQWKENKNKSNNNTVAQALDSIEKLMVFCGQGSVINRHLSYQYNELTSQEAMIVGRGDLSCLSPAEVTYKSILEVLLGETTQLTAEKGGSEDGYSEEESNFTITWRQLLGVIAFYAMPPSESVTNVISMLLQKIETAQSSIGGEFTLGHCLYGEPERIQQYTKTTSADGCTSKRVADIHMRATEFKDPCLALLSAYVRSDLDGDSAARAITNLLLNGTLVCPPPSVMHANSYSYFPSLFCFTLTNRKTDVGEVAQISNHFDSFVSSYFPSFIVSLLTRNLIIHRPKEFISAEGKMLVAFSTELEAMHALVVGGHEEQYSVSREQLLWWSLFILQFIEDDSCRLSAVKRFAERNVIELSRLLLVDSFSPAGKHETSRNAGGNKEALYPTLYKWSCMTREDMGDEYHKKINNDNALLLVSDMVRENIENFWRLSVKKGEY